MDSAYKSSSTLSNESSCAVLLWVQYVFSAADEEIIWKLRSNWSIRCVKMLPDDHEDLLEMLSNSLTRRHSNNERPTRVAVVLGPVLDRMDQHWNPSQLQLLSLDRALAIALRCRCRCPEAPIFLASDKRSIGQWISQTRDSSSMSSMSTRSVVSSSSTEKRTEQQLQAGYIFDGKIDMDNSDAIASSVLQHSKSKRCIFFYEHNQPAKNEGITSYCVSR